jgi:uncharacterized protein YgiM (DUF1202 family)
MKKIIIILIITAIFLSGCSKNDQMTNFIPTVKPEDNSSDEEIPTEVTPVGEENATDATPTTKAIYVGQTTTKYVMLTEYDDTLNVRSAPSTDAEKVGFLVHTEKIEVIEIKDGWASFLYNDAICYVNADFLVDEKPNFIEPPTPTAAPEKVPTPLPKAGGPEI